jgi:hypothetical protein
MKTITKLAALAVLGAAWAAACGGSVPKVPDVKPPDVPGVGDLAEAGVPGAGDLKPPTADTKDGGAGTTATKPPEPPKDCYKDMFKKYGEAAFLKVNDAIVKKAVDAPEDKIGKTFKALAKKPKDADRVKKNLAAFLVKVYGGPDNYKGKPMEAAHAKMKITSEQYDWFIQNVVVPALKENGVSEEDITYCFAPPVTDEKFKASIVGK